MLLRSTGPKEPGRKKAIGLQHLNIYTATQGPMTEVFDLQQRDWTFNSLPSAFLYHTQLPLSKRDIAVRKIPEPTHEADYWAAKTAEFNFTKEDSLGNPERFNRIIWEGLKGNVPYPSGSSDSELLKNRGKILQNSGGAAEDSKQSLEPASLGHL